MKLNIKDELSTFCKKHGYIGKCGYNQKEEFEIIISKYSNNAGAFLSKEEMDVLTVQELHSLFMLLHYGFKEKFIN